MAVRRIAGLSLTSADADALAEFYLALGFERVGVELRGGPGFARLMRLERADARAVLLRLGAEWLELVTFARGGQAYPRERASNDPWFQHFAIVVASMEEAYARLGRCAGWTAITHPEPQRLPESSGGVVAFKFRDPEGHPLELLEFPPDRTPAVWRARREAWPSRRGASGPRVAAPGPFLGIDHSAIVVASTERSMAFYCERLGFLRTGGSLNRGPEQARLDSLPDPEVEVTSLGAAEPQPPHLELLCYRAPARLGTARFGAPASRAASAAPAQSSNANAGLPQRSEPLASHDVAATRLLLEAERPPAASGAGELDMAWGALIHDPDGHALQVAVAD